MRLLHAVLLLALVAAACGQPNAAPVGAPGAAPSPAPGASGSVPSTTPGYYKQPAY